MRDRILTALRWSLRGLLLCLILGILAGGMGWLWLKHNILDTLPADLSAFRTWRPPTVCTVQATDGSLVDQFYVERRWWVPLDELPPHVPQAFLAAEDRRFYAHKGVDPQGIIRAAWTNFQAGGVSQGGSTITQQLVKNLIVGNERSYDRKLREAVLAQRLEEELGKDAVLELFMNYVFLGAGNYGVEAAARDYFGVSARELDEGQAALLAGLIPAPSRYNPRRSPEIAGERRRIVLQAMVAEGYVAPERLPLLNHAPVLLTRPAAGGAGDNTAYITQLRREIRRLLPPGMASDQGLTVESTLDPAVQSLAVAAIRDALLAHSIRQGHRVIRRHLTPEAQVGFLRRGEGLGRDPSTGALLPPVAGQCLEALVTVDRNLETLQSGPHALRLHPEDWTAPVRAEDPDRPPAPLRTRVRAGDVLAVCPSGEPGVVVLDRQPWAEGAAVVLDNATGEIRALVGGWDVGLEGFVRATQARRQPGSSFKPYVYGAALMAGKRQTDLVVDGPISLPAGGGKTWSPKNYSGGYAGALPMRTALAKSLNTVAVRLTLELGAERVAQVAKDMGVATPLRTDPTIALGSSEVTPMDQALGYATIARMGHPTEAVYVRRLLDGRGQVVGQAGGTVSIDETSLAQLPGGASRHVGAERPPTMPPGVAYELADMMREVVRSGTARKAWRADRDRAGKTGTTNGFQDAWFVGFSPEHTVAVWIGTDGTASLGDSETGGRAALPAWIRIMDAIDPEGPTRFAMPKQAVLVPWHGDWVGLPRGQVPDKLLTGRPQIRPGVPLGPI